MRGCLPQGYVWGGRRKYLVQGHDRSEGTCRQSALRRIAHCGDFPRSAVVVGLATRESCLWISGKAAWRLSNGREDIVLGTVLADSRGREAGVWGGFFRLSGNAEVEGCGTRMGAGRPKNTKVASRLPLGVSNRSCLLVLLPDRVRPAVQTLPELVLNP